MFTLTVKIASEVRSLGPGKIQHLGKELRILVRQDKTPGEAEITVLAPLRKTALEHLYNRTEGGTNSQRGRGQQPLRSGKTDPQSKSGLAT